MGHNCDLVSDETKNGENQTRLRWYSGIWFTRTVQMIERYKIVWKRLVWKRLVWKQEVAE